MRVVSRERRISTPLSGAGGGLGGGGDPSVGQAAQNLGTVAKPVAELEIYQLLLESGAAEVPSPYLLPTIIALGEIADFFESLFGGPHKVQDPKLRQPVHSIPEQADVNGGLVISMNGIVFVSDSSGETPKPNSSTCQGNWDCVHSEEIPDITVPGGPPVGCVCFWECFACNGSGELYDGDFMNYWLHMPKTGLLFGDADHCYAREPGPSTGCPKK